MEQKKQSSKIQKNWRKKGLGWIPDYPDARDYILQSSEIDKKDWLRKDRVTVSVEDLAKVTNKLIELLKQNRSDFQKVNSDNIPKEDTLSLDSIQADLKKNIFGGIDFVTVKIHKVLHQNEKPQQEVIELKHCLHILSSEKHLNFNEDMRDCIGESYEDKDFAYWQWMSSPLFDEVTQKVIKVFQDAIGIVNNDNDHIANLETHIAIKKQFYNLNEKVSWQNTFSLYPIVDTSLITQEIFIIIFEALKQWVVEIESLSGDQEKFDFDGFDQTKFIEILQEKFFLIEPIVSVFLQFFVPLASIESYDHLEQAFEHEFKQITQYNIKDYGIFQENLKQNFAQNFDRVDFQIATSISSQDIVKQVEQGVNQAIKQNNEEKRQDKKIKNDVLLALKEIYNLVQKEQFHFCKHLEIKIDPKKPINLSKIEIDLTKFIEPSDKEKISDLLDFYTLINKVAYHLYYETQLLDTINEKPKIRNSKNDFLIEINPVLKEDESSKSLSGYSLDLPVNSRFLSSNSSDPKFLTLPNVVDLSIWCSPVRDQENLNSCTAFAGIALIEYFARKRFGEYTQLSSLFLYKAARNLMQSFGDVGASVRETMKAMAVFGIPPEKYWSYEAEHFDEEPPSFCYSYAQNYQSLKYFRIDRSDITNQVLLFQIKAVLASGFPCVFGFTVYSSIYKAENTNNGYIPYPSPRDDVIGGHAVAAVGYDDYREIKHSNGTDRATTGAFLIRNSWGTEWGMKGYGWLPYKYVLDGLTADWWSLLKAGWFDTGNFGLGAYNPDSEDGSGQS